MFKPESAKAKLIKSTNGFDRGMEAAELLGATKMHGKIYFLIRWSGTAEAGLVPAQVTNLKIPAMVIEFYEKRMTWAETSQEDDLG